MAKVKKAVEGNVGEFLDALSSSDKGVEGGGGVETFGASLAVPGKWKYQYVKDESSAISQEAKVAMLPKGREKNYERMIRAHEFGHLMVTPEDLTEVVKRWKVKRDTQMYFENYKVNLFCQMKGVSGYRKGDDTTLFTERTAKLLESYLVKGHVREIAGALLQFAPIDRSGVLRRHILDKMEELETQGAYPVGLVTKFRYAVDRKLRNVERVYRRVRAETLKENKNFAEEELSKIARSFERQFPASMEKYEGNYIKEVEKRGGKPRYTTPEEKEREEEEKKRRAAMSREERREEAEKEREEAEGTRAREMALHETAGGEPRTPRFSASEEKGAKWGKMHIETLKMPITHFSMGRDYTSLKQMGRQFARPMRVFTDGKAFRTKRRNESFDSSFLLDGSGSMMWRSKELLDIIKNCRLGTVGVYDGWSWQEGTLYIVAKKGKRATDEEIELLCQRINNGNTVDGPAVKWLTKQPGRKFWCTDGGVHGVSGVVSEGMRQGLRNDVAKAKVTIVGKMKLLRTVRAFGVTEKAKASGGQLYGKENDN
jgi:hypothetical protein